MTVRLFDRYAKLRDAIRVGRIHTGQKEILTFLRGRLSKADVPAVVAEPAGLAELKAIFDFALEKHLKVALASGLSPVEVADLEGQILVLTTRLSGASQFSAARQCIRVDAGQPVDALVVDLSRAGARWMPLLPVPAGCTPGDMVASGWEGLRNWRDGGLMSHVDAIEWMGYDGKLYRTGPTSSLEGGVDLLPFLYGSRGSLGVITALELSVQPTPSARTAVLYELPDAHAALELMIALREMDAVPETVVYWSETATQILREGTDNIVSDKAVALISAEWRESVKWPESERAFAKPYTSPTAIDAMWQDLFRFQRTAARLYPERMGARLRVPALAVAEIEEAAHELGHDHNLQVALWGNFQAGHLHAWVLMPDDQPRTLRRGEDLLHKLLELAVNVGGQCAPGNRLPFEFKPAAGSESGAIAADVREQLRKKCDPNGLFLPLMGK